MRNIKSRMLKGSLWVSAGRIADNVLSFVTTIVLARLLLPSDFGLVALAASTLAIMTAVTEMPVAWALISKKDVAEELYHTAWTISATRGLVLAAAFSLLSWPMSLVYAEPRLVPVMCAMSAGLILTGMHNLRLTMMQKQLIFWQGVALIVVKAAVTAVVSIGIAIVYRSYWALVAGAIAGQLASTILSYSMFPFRPRLSFRNASELLSFSIWLTFNQAIGTLNQRLDHLLIGAVLGRAELGYYSVGSNLAVAPSREAVRPIGHTLFPALAAVADDPERLRRGYQRAQALVTAIALPAGLGFALVADPTVRLALGEKWVLAIGVIQVVGAYYAFATLGSLVGPVAIAKGATQLLFRRSLQALIVRIPIILVGMYFWGFLGLLYGSAVAGMLIIAINMRTVSSLIDLPVIRQLAANGRTLAAAISMAAAVIAMQRIWPAAPDTRALAVSLVISIIGGGITYLSAMLLLWVAAGRPGGPETEALELAGKIGSRFRGRAGNAPKDR